MIALTTVTLQTLRVPVRQAIRQTASEIPLLKVVARSMLPIFTVYVIPAAISR